MDEKYDVYNSAKNDIEAVTVVIEKCDGKWSMVGCPYGACARILASEFENHVKEFHQTNTLNEVVLPKPTSSLQKVDPIEVNAMVKDLDYKEQKIRQVQKRLDMDAEDSSRESSPSRPSSRASHSTITSRRKNKEPSNNDDVIKQVLLQNSELLKTMSNAFTLLTQNSRQQ